MNGEDIDHRKKKKFVKNTKKRLAKAPSYEYNKTKTFERIQEMLNNTEGNSKPASVPPCSIVKSQRRLL